MSLGPCVGRACVRHALVVCHRVHVCSWSAAGVRALSLATATQCLARVTIAHPTGWRQHGSRIVTSAERCLRMSAVAPSTASAVLPTVRSSSGPTTAPPLASPTVQQTPALCIHDEYMQLVAAGKIAANPAQEDVIHHLDQLRATLESQTPPVPARLHEGTQARKPRVVASFLSFLRAPIASLSAPPLKNPVAPPGVYIYGDVGAGKTMVMDLFFNRVAVVRKRRIHFNAFMLDVHARIHRWKLEHTTVARSR